MKRWHSGHSFVCSCDSAVRFLDMENSCQRRRLLLSGAAPKYFARPWTRASKPALTDSSLAAKIRAEALHVVVFSIKYPSPARLPTAANAAVLSYDT